MKILCITSMYPTKDKPYYGIFVKEQIEFLKKNKEIEIKLCILDNENSFKKYFSFNKILKSIKREKPDIIHIHYGLTGLPILFLYPFIYKVKIVTTYHGDDINGKSIIKFISILVSKISTINIAVSQEIFKKIKKYQNNIVWIPCGVDDSFCIKDENYLRKNIIIFPSSPKRKEKNFFMFQKVISILKDEYKLKPKIVVFENKNREEIKKALLVSKCLLLTSKSEGSPQVIKEAICCDTPIVSTAVGDVPFLVKNLKNCYIANTPDEMAKRIITIFNATLEEYPKSIKNEISNSYICDQIYHIYQSLIK